MKAEIFNIRTNSEGFERLAQLNSEFKGLVFEIVDLDFSNCGWFDANMCAPLGAILALLADELNSVKLSETKPQIQRILSKNSFLTHYGFQIVPDTNGTVVPYKRFDRKDDRYFAAYVNQYTQGKGIPAMSALLKKKFHEAIGELFANAITHSESHLGIFACGQYFPSKERFDFCITDAGSGFVGAIKRAFDVEVDSLKAMRKCLEDGFTTKLDEPGGLGLKLIRNFIELNKGRLVIVSNSAYYEFSHGGERFETLGKPFPGTCINIEINTADRAIYRLKSEA